MSLSSGTRLGPYEIVAPIGAGGMGEVYRARDTRLDRAVAIKVLPALLALDPMFVDRFEREAHTASSLNHPHICALYDVGQQEGVRFLVMELLEGETLAARLTRGALPLPEALRYGVQIADALSRAHKQGIVHRDLKPANVMLTKSGAKLLDFGLARVDANAAAAQGLTLATQDRSLTAAGTILGTFQYMAPEQLEGKEADARTDIFAFGAVLYEMTTGRKAFAGGSQASLIASIMASRPAPISTVDPLTPPALDRVVSLCLAKEPDDRWQTAQDMAAELKWIAEGGSQIGAPAAVSTRRKSRERLAWGAVAVLGLIAAAAVGRLVTLPRPSPPELTRFSIVSPKGVRLSWPRLSPDGRAVAFVGIDAQGVSSVFVRRLDSLEVVRLAGTEGVLRPFWSPDSRYLAFFAGPQLKKIAAGGGPTQLLGEQQGGADGTWSSAGVILFDGRTADPVRRIADGGGVPAVAVAPDQSRKEAGAAWPFFLPDGKHFLFLANGPGGPMALRLGTLDSSESTFLMDMTSRVEYSAGHIFFVSQQTLMARPFSAESLSFTGDPFPVTDRIQMQELGRANFSLSLTGDLTFMAETQLPISRLVAVDRAGRELGPIGEPAMYRELALSPDESRLAVAILAEKDTAYDVWVVDLKRGTRSRFTFGSFFEGFPMWSRDGQWIAYGAGTAESPLAVFRKPAGGGGAEALVYADKEKITVPLGWSADGSRLLVESLPSSTDTADLLTIASEKSGAPTPVIAAPRPLTESVGRFSPDGKWIAYQSNESGRVEIYVQAYPPTGGKWQISTAGGQWPMWTNGGKEIIYSTTDDTLFAVPVTIAADSLTAGTPARLFQHRLNRVGNGSRHRWVVSGNGQRFFLNVPIEDQDVTGAQVVLNWARALAKP
ncbi:MAG TPA: protein kinase [Vicinamibacterales bacterium]|nr:protein kinase [Vicinamibacterales bacterium]